MLIIIIKIQHMQNKNFPELIKILNSTSSFSDRLAELKNTYIFRVNKINQLDLPAIIDLYQGLERKYYYTAKATKEEAWHENELRVYVWVLFAYLHAYQKKIEALVVNAYIQGQQDWKYFSLIFNNKPPLFFQFQAQAVIRAEKRPPVWCKQQTFILQQIINQCESKNQWSSIARRLYVASSRRYFRTPKQCRERWINHIDPTKLKCQWTLEQDILLLTTIRDFGKKWSLVVRNLGNTRTQHMVKNRYKSFMAYEGKKASQKSEVATLNFLINKFCKLAEKNKEKVEPETIETIETMSNITQQQIERLQKESRQTKRQWSQNIHSFDEEVVSLMNKEWKQYDYVHCNQQEQLKLQVQAFCLFSDKYYLI